MTELKQYKAMYRVVISDNDNSKAHIIEEEKAFDIIRSMEAKKMHVLVEGNYIPRSKIECIHKLTQKDLEEMHKLSSANVRYFVVDTHYGRCKKMDKYIRKFSRIRCIPGEKDEVVEEWLGYHNSRAQGYTKVEEHEIDIN